jgi:hypothetical protein
MFLVWAAGSAVRADDLPREVVMLSHFKEKMRQNLAQVLNYTCLETIQRSERRSKAHVFKPLDSVLLEISSAENRELLAWPGARRFEDADLSSFSASGLMGSGVFASHARTVFLSNVAIIQYHGDEEIAGRPLARYDFSVPQAWSRFRIRTSVTTVTVGTKGSFWIDPASLELVRLEVLANGMPAELGIEQAATRIDYARMHIGASDVLLPQGAELLLTLLSGDALRNTVEFSHCREYHSESSIRFDLAETAPQRSQPQIRELDLPAGLMVSIELRTAIDSATAHVGDLLRGSVTQDVRLKGNPVIPKGAVVTGRIRGLDRALPAPSHALTIELAELEWEGTHAEFYGELVQVGATDARDPLLALPSIDGSPAMMAPTRPHDKTIVAPQIPGTGVLYMQGERFRIPPGLRMSWRTLDPNQRQRLK